MPTIKVLDNNLINKIAAGEVVERPSSVVKELVENSIDAGATSVTVEIENGGISLVRVTDNGRGISRDDVEPAFMRHATSKISSMTDFDTLSSMGFRGEALSSIASVSQVELITKRYEDITGTRVVVEGGELISVQEVGSSDGTTFIMRNLFYNTPVRRKFLKKPGTEGGYVSDIINRLALSRPDIAFRFIINGEALLSTNGSGELKTAILNVFGREPASKLIPVDYTNGGYTVSGYIGKPEIARANRTYECLFINGRFVKSQLIASAAEQAYGSRLMTGRFPFFALLLTADPVDVEVNVHPSKMEVRFGDEEQICEIIRSAVSEALNSESLIPAVTPKKPKFTEIIDVKPYTPIEPPAKQSAPLFDYSVAEEKAKYNVSPPAVKEAKPEPVNPAEKALPIKKSLVGGTLIGQAFATYWVYEKDDELFLIDQHAAHEKIIYEHLIAKHRAGEMHSQPLLIPETVELSIFEMQLIEENAEMFEKFGFNIEPFGERTVIIREAPFIADICPDAGFFKDLLDGLFEPVNKPSEMAEHFADKMALASCKAAMKANDAISRAEAELLINRLIELENPYSCPHGRPTIVSMTKKEIEKMFKRIV